MSELFSRNTIDFLVENKLRDDRVWFNEHREQYQSYVIEPFAAMVTALAPVMAEIDRKLICAPKVGGSISRIWRDARFSKDKSLFRNYMWCTFVREKHVGLPEYFFAVSPDDFCYGCGYYSAGSESMARIRELILKGDKSFKDALSAYESQNGFKLEGEMYKRSKYPDAPENLRQWLDRKSISLIKTCYDFELLFSDRIYDEVASGFKSLAPAYLFMQNGYQESKQPR